MDQLASARGNLIQRHEYSVGSATITDESARVGVFICHCGHNIASVIDVGQVADRRPKCPMSYHAEASLYTCFGH